MKTIIAFFFSAFFAGVNLAQDQIKQPPPSAQTDTTSGWKLVFSNPNYAVNNHTIGNLQFPSKDTGYANAFNGSREILLRTTNAGITWDSLPYVLPPGSAKFITSLTAYTEGSNTLYKTIDGGMNWQAYPAKVGVEGYLLFPSMDTILAIASINYTRTTDGGSTWKELFPPNDVTKNGGSFADSKTGYMVGDLTGIQGHPDWLAAGYCQKTTDAGATWTQMYTGIHADLLCSAVINRNTLYVAGSQNYGSYFGRTFDGGVTWDTLFIGDANSYFPALSFADSLHGLVVGAKSLNEGIILSTIDGGKSWQTQYSPRISVLSGVTMLSNSVVIVCGGSNIYRTTTGGNFSSVAQQHTINFHVQTFPNPTSGAVTIQYQLPTAQSVSFNFYTLQGTTVGTINPGIQNAGSNQVVFDGSQLANGAYFFTLTTPQDFYNGSFTIQK